MVIFSFSYTWQVCFPFLLWESVEKLAWPDQRLGRRRGGGGVIPDTLKGPCWMPKWQSFFALVYTSSRVIPPPPPLEWKPVREEPHLEACYRKSPFLYLAINVISSKNIDKNC